MSSSRRFYRPPSAATYQEPLEKEVHGAYKKKIDPSYLDQEGRGPLHLLLLLEGDGAPHVVDHVIKSAGCGVNVPDRNGTRPLMYAARQGAVRCLRILLGHGATLDEQDNVGDTALMVSAASGQPQALELLIRAGAAVNLTNDRGQNALHHAIRGGCEDCVRSLLKYGCRMNHQDTSGQTPLHIAARAGNADILEILLKTYPHAKAQVNLQDSYGRTALHWTCCRDSNPACLNLLLEHAPDTSIFDKEHNSPVLLAIKANQVVQLEALLDVPARKITKDGRSPISLACLLGYLDCTQLLLDSGLDSNLSGHFDQSPLICAAFESRTDLVEMLLSQGANPNGLTSTTPLFSALSCINVNNAVVRHAIIAKLLSAGADPNVKAARSWYFSPITKHVVSPLSLAFDSGYVSLVRMLLTAGCSITKSELVAWVNDNNQQSNIYDRDVLLQPIHSLVTQPLSLTLQIRIAIRRCISKCQSSPRSLVEKIHTLPIAPRLISFLLLEELFDEAPELAPDGSSAPRNPRLWSYHPFQERRTQGIQDLGNFEVLRGTLLFETLLS